MITISWYSSDEDIILWETIGSATIPDYRVAFEQTTAMMLAKSYRVDVIRDRAFAKQIPHDLLYTMIELHQKRNQILKQQGIIVIVRASQIVKILYRVLNKMPQSYKRYRFASSIEDALRIIHEERSLNENWDTLSRFV